ncbi:acetolactate synthase [Arthrobacter sp. LS16]|nr:acetolactate synthase [Arthrobacter sp. LS16]
MSNFPSNPTHAGQAIVDSLALHGVDRVFTVPGESYLAVLDGLHGAKIENVIARQEGGASYMAEAYGKFTGRPGVAMVTRGPGASNAYVGIHTAWQDGTPMVLFVGLIPVADRMRESFQEFDPYAWFGTQTKRVFVLDEPDRASEIVAEAFFAASSGRPGPVVVGLPEDVIAMEFAAGLTEPIPVAEGAVDAAQLAEITAALAGAQRPLLMVGGQRWNARAAAQVTAFAESNNIPVVQDWHAADRIPFDSPVNMGSLGYGRSDTAAKMLADADALVLIGCVLGDVSSDGYSLRQNPDAVNYVVSPDTTLRGRSGHLTAHVLASPIAFAAAIEGLELGGTQRWESWRAAGREAQKHLCTIPDDNELPATAPGTARMSVVMRELVSRVPQNVVNSVGAGNHTAWAQWYMPTNVYPSALSTRNGSMGYSIPAAVVAAKQAPQRLSVAVCGDGEFLMNGQEFATAVQFGAPILVVVMDNGQFATIRDHQEHHFPGRVSGTQLRNPDFAAFARAFGGHGEYVADDAQVEAAVERALAAVAEGRPALIHVVTDQAIAVP